jgi:KDO2-lipid IV(A) lauroyltransferase
MTAVVLRLLEAVVAWLPQAFAQRLGALLGAAVHAFVPIRRSEVRRRIAERLGCAPVEARRIAREMYRHLGTSALEFLWMAGRPPAAAAELVRREGEEHYQAALARARGVVVVTGHVGNWDLGACSQAAAGVPLHVVTKTLSARGLSRYWMERRRAHGVVLHGASGSLGALVAALRAGEVVGLVVDQRADQGGIDVPLFGVPARTSVAAATLALRTGAPLVPAFVTRDARGRHTLHIEPPIEIDHTLPVGDAIATATRACNEALERAVRRAPEQWLWLHRRWDAPRPSHRTTA